MPVRPCGSEAFVRMLEDQPDRLLAPQKHFPNPKIFPGEDLFPASGTIRQTIPEIKPCPATPISKGAPWVFH